MERHFLLSVPRLSKHGQNLVSNPLVTEGVSPFNVNKLTIVDMGSNPIGTINLVSVKTKEKQ